MNFAHELIMLLKKHIAGESINADALIMALAKEIDRLRVNNQPSADIEALYADAMWLKCEILNDTSK